MGKRKSIQKRLKEVINIRKDERIKYKVGKSIKVAIDQLGGVPRVARYSHIPKSTLYKYMANSHNILRRKAETLSHILELEPIFSNGVFEVNIKDKPLLRLVKPNYCFHCGNKLKDKNND